MIRFNSLAAALTAVCIEHNVKGCNACNKTHDECDFGGCHAPATTKVALLNAAGNVGEIRIACEPCVPFMRQAAPYGVAA